MDDPAMSFCIYYNLYILVSDYVESARDSLA